MLFYNRTLREIWPQGKTSYIIFWAQCEVQFALTWNVFKILLLHFEWQENIKPSMGVLLQGSGPVRLSISIPQEATVCVASPRIPVGLKAVAEWQQRDFWRSDHKKWCTVYLVLCWYPFGARAAFISNLSVSRTPCMEEAQNDPNGGGPHGETLRLHEMKRRLWAISYYGAPAIPASITMGTTDHIWFSEPSSWALPEIPDREKPWTIIGNYCSSKILSFGGDVLCSNG